MGIIVPLLIFEIILWFLPVHEGHHLLPVNEQNPILRFQPNRTYIRSAGWNFNLVNKVHVNNYGFVNDCDYDENATSPLIAIIGDSNTVALMVPFQETLNGRLAKKLGKKYRVYNFARGGSPLSQYLVHAEYAKSTFHPTGMIFVVVANDFDESLGKYHWGGGHHRFVEHDDGKLVLKRSDVSISLFKKIARKSALIRYLVINLKISSLPSRVKHFFSKQDESQLYESNTLRDANQIRVADSKRAIDAFFDMLPQYSGLNPPDALFVIDGIRDDCYGNGRGEINKPTFFRIMRDYFIHSCKAQDYEIIDMHPIFTEHFKLNGERFEHPTDWHWNGLGHKVIYEAITRSEFFDRFTQKETD